MVMADLAFLSIGERMLKISEDGPTPPRISEGSGRERGASVTMPHGVQPGMRLSVLLPDGEQGLVDVPEGAVEGQTLELAMALLDANGDQLVELVKPTADTKLGLTFGEFRGQVVIHQVFAGYPAENLQAGDFVHAVNDTPVTAEAAATLLAGRAGERLKLRLRPPPGACMVSFDKTRGDQRLGLEQHGHLVITPLAAWCPSSAAPAPPQGAPGACAARHSQGGSRPPASRPQRLSCSSEPPPKPLISLRSTLRLELCYDAPSGRVRVVGIAADSPARAAAANSQPGGGGLVVGDVLLAVNGVRAVDVETVAAVMDMVARRVEVRVLRFGGDLEIVEIVKGAPQPRAAARAPAATETGLVTTTATTTTTTTTATTTAAAAAAATAAAATTTTDAAAAATTTHLVQRDNVSRLEARQRHRGHHHCDPGRACTRVHVSGAAEDVAEAKGSGRRRGRT